MAWTALTDVRCCYDVVGQGPPLLLVPGLGVTRSVWDAALPELAQHFSLVLLDNRDVGRSQPIRQAESLRDYVADSIELLDYLQLDHAHVMGISLGGVIARRLAADHPSRVDRLVLVSCTDRYTPYLRQILGLLGGVLKDMPASAFARTIETLGTSPHFYDESADLIECRVKEKCECVQPAQIAGQLRCLAAEVEADDDAEQITAPTLVIAGDHDVLTPACYAEAMARRIPNSRFLTIPNAGHNPLLECPRRVVPPIVQFLTQSSPEKKLAAVRGTGERNPLTARKEPTG